jgi:Trypsin
LIQTIESIKFGPMVLPVRLTPDRVSAGNLTAVMAGFGQTRLEPRTDVKQYLQMKTLSSPDCRRHYSRNFPFNAVRIFDSNICFSNPVGRGMCGGKFYHKLSVLVIQSGDFIR